MKVNFRRLKNPYDKEWKDYIERISQDRKKPFDSWFPNGDREYFYLNSEELSSEDIDVVEFIEDVKGYEIIDYRKGLAKRPGSNRENKIGKLLTRWKANDLKEIKKKFERGEIFSYKREYKREEKFYDQLLSSFNSSAYRGVSKNLVIVISQDPHDIAKMSTDRTWESCMTLGSGLHHKDVFCEIKEGGLIAYLTYPGDNDIEKPISRLRIRRFTNENGDNLAIPEESIYGQEVEEFAEAVVGWIAARQPEVPPGVYKLTGGEYSDTFDDDYFHFPNYSTDKLISLFMMKDGGEEFITPYYTLGSEYLPAGCDDYDIYYNDEEMTLEDYIDEVVEPLEFKTEEEAIIEADRYNRIVWHYLDECLESRRAWAEEEDEEEEEDYYEIFKVNKELKDIRDEVRLHAAEELVGKPKGEVPLEIIEAIKDYPWGFQGRPIGRILIDRYPEIMSYKDVERYKLGSSFLSQIKDKDVLMNEMIDTVRAFSEDPGLVIPKNERVFDGKKLSCDEIPSSRIINIATEIGNFYTDVLSVMQKVFRPIPEPTIRDLVKIAEDFPVLINDARTDTRGLYTARLGLLLPSYIVNTFAATNSDTPTVQRFYRRLLPYWEPLEAGVISLEDLGRALGLLGINGREFLPEINRYIFMLEEEYGEILSPDVPMEPYDYNLRTARRRYEKLLWIRFSIEHPNKKNIYNFFPDYD